MEEFFRDLGFRIAGNIEVAIAIGVLCALAGVLLAVRALQDTEDLGDHRAFVVICGLGLAALIAVSMPLLHRMAERSCEDWSRSGEPADELAYLRERCADLF